MRATLDGLVADTRYRFEVSVAGKNDPAWAGSFKTAPESGKPGRFRVAHTSCMKFGQPQASWYLLLAQQPDLHLTLGDTHYADTTDPKVQWEHHESDRVGYPFVEVVSSGVANSGTLSFSTIDFDTTRPDPSVRVRIVWGDGTVRDDRTWKLSELGGERGPKKQPSDEG